VPLTQRWIGVAGAGILAGAWLWPLPWLPAPPFTAHMVGHMAVVALAAPLIAGSVAGGGLDPTFSRYGALISPIPASMIDGAAVWAWHAPALHHAARHDAWAFALEQATFLGGGVLLWMAALGGGAARRRDRAVGGVIALLLTSMHMTLLGALIALTPRLLYGAHHGGGGGLEALQDQQLGGVVMILLGGAVYGAGGLWLASDLLRPPTPRGSRS
jgi:putative membrane protein